MTDIQLLEMYKSGDIHAFGKIYEKYVNQIYRFVYLKVSSQRVAEDIVSETFLKCLNALENFTPQFESSLKSWVYTIAYNLVKDFYRTRKDDINIDELFSLWFDEKLWNDLDCKRRLEEVQTFLKSIKEEQREILLMRIWDDLSYKEISMITGKSENNCKKIVSRVLRNINANIAIFILLLTI